MSNKRLIKDFQTLYNDAKDNNIFVDDSTDLSQINTIIIGPKNTSFQGGFFWIKLEPSAKYPFEPPKGTFMSPVQKLRVHPNLYCEGKICLSILGTWSGPSWTSLLNFSSIILSIQSILCENPITNEPGCEKYSKESAISSNYNIVVKYTTLRMILNFLQCKYNVSSYLQNKINEYVKNNLDEYENLFSEHQETYTVNGISYYGLTGLKLNFAELYQEWKKTIDKIINIDTIKSDVVEI